MNAFSPMKKRKKNTLKPVSAANKLLILLSGSELLWVTLTVTQVLAFFFRFKTDKNGSCRDENHFGRIFTFNDI